MAESYCGKSCAECTYRQEKQCLGCKAGPGTGCDIGRCVMGKGHSTCNTCAYITHCGIYRGRDKAMENRIRALEAERVRQEEIRTRTKGLDVVFFLLFWLVVPRTIGSLMTEKFLSNPYPVLGTIGIFISSLSNLLYGMILLSQYRRERGYLIAGSLSIAVAVLDFISEFNAPPEGTFNFATVIGLAAGVVQLVAIYKEFAAHAEVLTGVDEIADKWLGLWRWTIGTHCAVLGSVIVAIIAPLLGVLVALAGAIGVIVVDIVRLVYLYRSAKACQKY